MRTLNFNRISNEADTSGVIHPTNRPIRYWGFRIWASKRRVKMCGQRVLWKVCALCVGTGSTSTAVWCSTETKPKSLSVQSNEIMPLSQACHSLCADPSEQGQQSLHFFLFQTTFTCSLLYIFLHARVRHLCLTNKIDLNIFIKSLTWLWRIRSHDWSTHSKVLRW